MYQFNEEEYRKRMEWYVDARFGMFLHWGLYAIPARGEWMRSFEKVTDEEYQKYFNEFNPVDYVLDDIEAKWLKKHKPKNPNSFTEQLQLRTQTRMMAEEIVIMDVVMQFH